MCKAPDGRPIWRLPKSGKWTDGSRGYDKHGVNVLVWHNKHGVETTAGPKAGVKNAQTVTVSLQLHGGDLICGWCRGRFVEQREIEL
jgi:hypothetical protein